MTKEELLSEITTLLNEYGETSNINPSVLEFLDETDLLEIKKSLMKSKKHHLDDNEWLQQFKKDL